MNNLISVIIPCYQQGHFLNDAVTSLQAQTYTHWEAIIVNDGSMDETEYIAGLLCAADSRVHYVSKPNGGLSSARNAGLALASGRWIQFLDADDLLLPLKFEIQLAAAASVDSQVLIYSDFFYGACDDPTCRVDPWQPSRKFIMSRPLLDMALRWELELSIPLHTVLFPAWLFRDEGLRFDESLLNHEDWDMWMQVLPRVNAVLFTPYELVIYRVGHNSMTQDRSIMWQGFADAIKKQKRLFLHDGELKRALTYLNTVNNYIHRKGIRGRVCHMFESNTLSWLPWYLARLIRRFCNPPRKPFFVSRIK